MRAKNKRSNTGGGYKFYENFTKLQILPALFLQFSLVHMQKHNKIQCKVTEVANYTEADKTASQSRRLSDLTQSAK